MINLDSKQTRNHVILEFLKGLFALTGFTVRRSGGRITPLENQPIVVVGFNVGKGESKRTASDLGPGDYEWKDNWMASIYFKCPTDMEGALDEMSAAYLHVLERAVEMTESDPDYMYDGKTILESDELDVVVQSIVVDGGMPNQIDSKDIGIATLTGTITSGIAWKISQ